MSNAHVRIRALSSRQEKNLVDYLDERFLELTRGYKKRLVYPKPYEVPGVIRHFVSCCDQLLVPSLQPTCQRSLIISKQPVKSCLLYCKFRLSIPRPPSGQLISFTLRTMS